ncbi:DUF2834 domain-containing protein [Solimonas variicoloris]|uniref:DUF2834 domain-containing protein n=1 Tax=Solimonas variicoloris TaxID=254408 RepID=UPI00036205D0|nr:DUF2834 domain-containing protein [Solimonas variicoloris]
MTVTRKLLCVAYASIALLALIGTWSHNVAYLPLGFAGANLRFWGDTFANPASRSITVDLFFLSFAVLVWMVLEARRLHMRGVWLYLLFGLLIAISVTVPLFLIHRERVLAVRAPGTPAGRLATGDLIGLALLVLATLAYTATTLVRAPA